MQSPPGRCYALVAGEASGDNLGGPLITALAALDPAAAFCGIAGPRMTAAGCTAWYPTDTLAVMGLAEILRHLPRLLRVRRDVIARLLAARPAAFIGIDSPEFNLRIATDLKARGVPTVQYVSPQVWAWRQGRVRTIGAAVDLVLCVLPFEVEFYDAHSVNAVFVGHPLADRIPLESDRTAARASLGLPQGAPIVAVLPGSRAGEVARLGPPFAATVRWLAERRPDLEFVAPMANDTARRLFDRELSKRAAGVRVHLVDGRAQGALAACDAALVTSGTATLETALVNRPMVVAYRVAPLTGWLLRRLSLVKTRHFSQPNLLAGRELVPEFFQEQVRAELLGPAMLAQLERPDRADLEAAFREMHVRLRRNASERAAEAIVDLVRRKERT
jgi:lipid-A-disaccharide synthase